MRSLEFQLEAGRQFRKNESDATSPSKLSAVIPRDGTQSFGAASQIKITPVFHAVAAGQAVRNGTKLF